MKEHSTDSRKGPSNQISNSEKIQVRLNAKFFSSELLKAELKEGLRIFQKTIEEIYDGKARLRICLRCGEIKKALELTKDTHKCTKFFTSRTFPYLITTSWLRMRSFFLGAKYHQLMKKLDVNYIEPKSIFKKKEK
ncbi:MAG: hypothetical protein ACXAAM_05350 [Candidatus Heimdallarchaeaceae archaeon]|jgi:hypothetical protein